MNKWEFLDDEYGDEKPFERIERQRIGPEETPPDRRKNKLKKTRKQVREKKEYVPTIEEEPFDED
jgi:hypothetical protein